jgi:hypothetical protein
MFGQKEYDEYVRLKKVAENVYNYYGGGPEYKRAQDEVNDAYGRYENAVRREIANERTPEEAFKDGQMHEWLISNGFVLMGNEYLAPPNADPAHLIAAHIRIYGTEIVPNIRVHEKEEEEEEEEEY